MTENLSYLSQILGPGALTINTIRGDHITWGEFDSENGVPPLTGIKEHNDVLSLTVSPEHMAGHFTDTQTLPAYRMLQLAGLVAGQDARISQISDAKFSRIVTQGDTLQAFVDRSVHIVRDMPNTTQDIAEAKFTYSDEGLDPYSAGIMLELAAQTIMANMAMRRNIQGLYPLILSVDSIQMHYSDITRFLNVLSPQLSELDGKNNFKGSAEIASDGNQSIATVEGISFHLATADQIQIYDAFGRNY